MKRKEAEKSRLLDIERRQKQRVKEIRETQEQVLQSSCVNFLCLSNLSFFVNIVCFTLFCFLLSQEKENMNLKEIYRTKVQNDLKNLEMTCHDMPSLLRGLGIFVDDSSTQVSSMFFWFFIFNYL